MNRLEVKRYLEQTLAPARRSALHTVVYAVLATLFGITWCWLRLARGRWDGYSVLAAWILFLTYNWTMALATLGQVQSTGLLLQILFLDLHPEKGGIGDVGPIAIMLGSQVEKLGRVTNLSRFNPITFWVVFRTNFAAKQTLRQALAAGFTK